MDKNADEAPAQKVIIPYGPRRHFQAFHDSKRRFKFVVAHRRAGKTVAEFNELLVKAMLNPRKHPHPRYAYVGPSFDQTKDLVWSYAKYYAGAIPGTEFSEGDLEVRLPNSATIRLYGGAAAYERMRGVYFDGIVLDEFPLLYPTVFSSVVRPCLADYRGFGIVSGTSNGDDHFHALKKKNEGKPNWDIFTIPVTETDALSPQEVIDMTEDMTPEEYAREMLCSFDAPIEGSYYAEALNQIAAMGRICSVPYDASVPVCTAWDLGIHDTMCIWFFQICGREIHWIDYVQGTGKGLDYYVDILNKKKVMFSGPTGTSGYRYRAHCLPHDVEARELSTGQSRKATLENLVGLEEPVIVAPLASPEDGINAFRGLLGMSWFDESKTKQGMAGLRAYQRSKTGRPLHNWASHPADAARTGATAFHLISGLHSWSGVGKKLRRRIRGII